MSHVRLQAIEKSFGKNPVVRELSLEIRAGEFFSLLGPSGCGKTTTLRMIAGFELPERGSIFFADQEVTSRKPSARNTGMVFQNYALFPHLTVFENVAFGLRARKTPEAEMHSRVQESLRLVDLAGMEQRSVTQLSGGQQQRVALARALAIRPAILLLDEPLSNLDAQLRKSTRAELKRLQRQLGITTIYVTHDQEEALALSDRMAVMHQGVLQQVGTPQEIYRQPQNLFVMNFIGSCNILRGEIAEQSGQQILISAAGGQIRLPHPRPAQALPGKPVHIAFRPEHAGFTQLAPPASPADDEILLRAKWRSAEFAGTHWLVDVEVADTPCSVRILPEQAVKELGSELQTLPVGTAVWLRLKKDCLMVFDNY